MTLDFLGPYQIVGELGRGGMGTVYEAVNRESSEPAAIKLLSASLAAEEGFRERFISEIDTLKKLNHPNVVRLFGYGEQDGHLFYAMELIDGSSLEEELSNGRRFDWRETTDVAIQICQALRHAHDRGIIHRDLKPANLLLTREHQVKLADFGIARLFGNTRLTCAGSVLGTADFMSPEQAEGKPVDARSDLYSLGGVIYVMLARRPLFTAKSLFEMLDKQRREAPVPLGKYAPDSPDELQQIVMQLLDKSPEKRVANALLLSKRLMAMRHALSIMPEAMHGPLLPEEPPELVSAAPSSEPNMTQALTPPVPLSRQYETLQVEPEPNAPDPNGNTKETHLAQRLAVAEASLPLAAEPSRKPTGKFVVVDPAELDPKLDDERPPLVSVWTLALIGALSALGLMVWFFLQPPSADALFDQIHRQSANSGLGFDGTEDEIDEFLLRFPKDTRAATVQGYRREIELGRMQRKFDRRMKGYDAGGNLLPIERAYFEAITNARVDADAAIVKLQALVDFYGPRSDDAGPRGLCLELAQRRLDQLRQEQQRAIDDLVAAVNERLEEVARIRGSEPKRAAAICRALVELYGEKTWARDAVAKARENLAAIASELP